MTVTAFFLLVAITTTVECIRPGRLYDEADESFSLSSELSSRVEALRGSNLTLRCPFLLEPGEQLYSIKWHKKLEESGEGGSGTYAEFYSVIFSQPLPTIHHKTTVPGVRLLIGEEKTKDWDKEVHQEVGESVTLLSVDLDTEGSYRCVATADGFFEAVRQQMNVIVFIPPTSPPKMISTHQQIYGIGERVSLSCTSSPSRPKSSISWFINDIPAPEDYVKVLEVPENEEEEILRSTFSVLEFTLQAEHLIPSSSSFTVRCSSLMAARFLPSATSVNSQNSREVKLDAMHVNTPLIVGLREEYEVGEWIDLNCTVPALLKPKSSEVEKGSNKNKQTPRRNRSISLEWHVNGRKAHNSWVVNHFVPGLLGLRFQLEEEHLILEEQDEDEVLTPPPMTIKCLSVQAWPADPRMPAPANGTVKVRESVLEEDELWPMARRRKGKKKNPNLTRIDDERRRRPVLVEVIKQSSTSISASTTTAVAPAATEKANGTTAITTAEEALDEDNSTSIIAAITAITTEEDLIISTVTDEVGATEDFSTTTPVSTTSASTSASTFATATATTIGPELSSTTTDVLEPTSEDGPRVIESLRQLGNDHKLLLLPIVLLGAIFALF